MSSPFEEIAAALRMKTPPEDVRDYLRSNVPADGWGLRDKGADADRVALLERVNATLDGHGIPPPSNTEKPR